MSFLWLPVSKRAGTSLAPILRGDTEALRDRTLFVHSQRIEYPEKWRKCAVMTEKWRLVNGQELYDIKTDPGQRNDLAADHCARNSQSVDVNEKLSDRRRFERKRTKLICCREEGALRAIDRDHYPL